MLTEMLLYNLNKLQGQVHCTLLQNIIRAEQIIHWTLYTREGFGTICAVVNQLLAWQFNHCKNVVFTLLTAYFTVERNIDHRRWSEKMTQISRPHKKIKVVSTILLIKVVTFYLWRHKCWKIPVEKESSLSMGGTGFEKCMCWRWRHNKSGVKR